MAISHRAIARELAATPEEQDLARDLLRKADHEVDFAFTSALSDAACQRIPATPEIKAILERISKVNRKMRNWTRILRDLRNSSRNAKEDQKENLTQQLDLAKSRQELIEDELADAHQDLERAGGDPQQPGPANGR